MQTIDMTELDWEVKETNRNMELACVVWMNTPVHAPEAEQVRKAKDAAVLSYLAALTKRGQAGGRNYPSWRELPERHMPGC